MKRTLDKHPSVAAVQIMVEALLHPVEVWYDQVNKELRIRKPSTNPPRSVGAYVIAEYDRDANIQDITDEITKTINVLENANSPEHKANKVKLNPEKRPSRFRCGKTLTPI